MRVYRLITLILMISVFLPHATFAEKLLIVKSRTTPVDVDKPYFEYLDTSKSSIVRGAWYDSSKEYMIINLNGANYHYCGLDKNTWEILKGADSYGTTYHKKVKNKFNCTIQSPPEY